MNYEVLDEKRKEVLPVLKSFKTRFYLAGGTALALYLGHRKSIDFDFFTQEIFSEQKLIEELEGLFVTEGVSILQLEKGTVTVLVGGDVKVSFFYYPYILLDPCKEEVYLHVAAIRDIACMKLSAICSRATNKDYVDLYYLLKKCTLSELLDAVTLKFPALDHAVILKSLTYFDDIQQDPLIMMDTFNPSFKEVQNSLRETVDAFMNKEIEGIF